MIEYVNTEKEHFKRSAEMKEKEASMKLFDEGRARDEARRTRIATKGRCRAAAMPKKEAIKAQYGDGRLPFSVCS